MTSAVARGALRAALEDFWSGFTTPSRFSFGLTLGIFLALLIAVCVLVTPALLSGPIGAYLPHDTEDGDGFATREILQLRHVPRTDKAPHLFVIGDSRIAQDFANDARLAGDLGVATGQPWHVSFLTTGRQAPLDEAALAEMATQQRPGVVVLLLSFDRYAASAPELIDAYRMGRLGFRSAWADQEMRMMGEVPQWRTGIYVVDNRKFLSRNLRMLSTRALTGQAAQRRIDSFLLTDHPTPKKLDSQKAVILAALRGDKPADALGMRLLAFLAHQLQAKGNRVVFVEDPIDRAPFEGPADERLYQAYLRQSVRTAQDLGGYYCRINRHYVPNASAFGDYFHIADPAGQASFRRTLAACVADALAGTSRQP